MSGFRILWIRIYMMLRWIFWHTEFGIVLKCLSIHVAGLPCRVTLVSIVRSQCRCFILQVEFPAVPVN